MKLKINKIIIHCSDTPNGRDHDAADIHRWHQQRGWSGIGYHYVIKLNGDVENGRPDYWQGAHAQAHNNNSLGVCLIGRDEFTHNQHQGLHILLESLLIDYPDAKVIGHNEVSSKTCPNFNVQNWLVEHGFN